MAFEYSGESVAAAFTAGVLNMMQSLATAYEDQAKEAYTELRTHVSDIEDPPEAADSNARYGTGKAGTSFSRPDSAFPSTPVVIDLTPLREKQDGLDGVLASRFHVLDDLVTQVEGFFDEFFPGVNEAVEEARVALEEMIAGSNFADGVQRARIRFDMEQDKLRRGLVDAEADMLAKYAARGFPAPPGALVFEMGQAQRANLYGLADASLTIDEEESRREAQNLERSLRLLVNTRNQAITAFSSYLAAAATDRYDEAMAKTKRVQDAEMLLNDAVYRHIIGVNKVASTRLKQTEADLRLSDAYIATANKFVESVYDTHMKSMTQNAQTLATVVATAYNQMRAQTGVNGRESF